jgi:hypothetical protein
MQATTARLVITEIEPCRLNRNPEWGRPPTILYIAYHEPASDPLG